MNQLFELIDLISMTLSLTVTYRHLLTGLISHYVFMLFSNINIQRFVKNTHTQKHLGICNCCLNASMSIQNYPLWAALNTVNESKCHFSYRFYRLFEEKKIKVEMEVFTPKDVALKLIQRYKNGRKG